MRVPIKVLSFFRYDGHVIHLDRETVKAKGRIICNVNEPPVHR